MALAVPAQRRCGFTFTPARRSPSWTWSPAAGRWAAVRTTASASEGSLRLSWNWPSPPLRCGSREHARSGSAEGRSMPGPGGSFSPARRWSSRGAGCLRLPPVRPAGTVRCSAPSPRASGRSHRVRHRCSWPSPGPTPVRPSPSARRPSASSGRLDHCAIRLRDPAVSRRQLRLVRAPDGIRSIRSRREIPCGTTGGDSAEGRCSAQVTSWASGERCSATSPGRRRPSIHRRNPGPRDAGEPRCGATWAQCRRDSPARSTSSCISRRCWVKKLVKCIPRRRARTA